MKPLAILATHPIQYYAPLYRVVSDLLGGNLRVFYHHIPDAHEQAGEFGQPFQWDVDLFSGYDHAAGQPGLRELWQGISQRRWSAVLVHGWNHAFYREAIARAWWNRVPVMVRGDSHLHTPRNLWKKLSKRVVHPWFFHQIQTFLAVGQWNEEYYRYYGVPEERIVMSPHCVDNRWFEAQAAKWRPQRAQLREAWGFSSGDTVILYAGKLIGCKHIGDFIDALVRGRQRGAGVQGLVVGEGIMRENLEAQARRDGAPVRWAGFMNQTEIGKAYVAADCLWLGGEETWGLVVNEALACGLPCLVSDHVGCAVDLVVPGVTGAVYPCGDVERLTERMLEMVRDRRRFSAGNAAWQAVLSAHSCDAAGQGIRRALELVAE